MDGTEEGKRTSDAAAGEDRPIRFFVSYAHDDKALSATLAGKLQVLFRGHTHVSFELWSDHQILPGTQWRGEIQKAMENCDAAVLMVSPAFVASDFIRKVELPYLLQNKRVIPVALKPIPQKTIPKDLEALQIFYDTSHKSFIDRTNDRTREAFALQLFERICAIVGGQPEQEPRIPATVRRLGPKDARYFINHAYPLLESRIPESELRSEEDMVRFLGESHEKFRYFLVAELGGKAEGFLYATAGRTSFNPFISYLVVSRGSSNHRELAGLLLEELSNHVQRDAPNADSARFLLEIEDPANTKDPTERRERLARFRLFAGMAQASGFDLRLIHMPYFQPRIGVDPDAAEVPLALLVARPKSEQGWHAMPKSEATSVMKHIYLEHYGTSYSGDPVEREKFQKECQDLCERVVASMRDPVRLLDWSSYTRVLRTSHQEP